MDHQFAFQLDICSDNGTAGIFWHPMPSMPPNLSQCARLALLPWSSFLSILALSPVFAFQLRQISLSPYRPLPLPLSPLLMAKYSLATLLIGFSFGQFICLSFSTPMAPFLIFAASFAKLTSLTALFLGQWLAQLKGIISSGCLHLGCLSLLLASFPDCYAAFQNFLMPAHFEPNLFLVNSNFNAHSIFLVLSFFSFSALLAQFIFLFFVDSRRHSANSQFNKFSFNFSTQSANSTFSSPELDSSFFSRLIFLWFRHFPKFARQNDLTLEDLFKLEDQNRTEYLVPLWEQIWQSKAPKNDSKANPSIPFVLLKLFKWELIGSGLFFALANFLQLTSPFLLNNLINFVTDSNAPLWQGISIAFFMFFCSQIRSLLNVHALYTMGRIGLKTQTILTAAIYSKSLRLSNAARHCRTFGEIVNLMAIDVERFQSITAYIQLTWDGPLQIILALALLFNVLGISALPGLILMLAIIPTSFIGSIFTRKFQQQQMKYKDERVKMCSELLGGIKMVKHFAWEGPMVGAVEAIRAKECQCIFKSGMVKSLIDTLVFCSPFLVALASFLTFCLLHPSKLTPQIAFVSLALFNQIQQPMVLLGFLVNLLAQAVVSNERIREFLKADELEMKKGEWEETEDPKTVICLENATFSWGSRQSFEPILRQITFRAAEGQLIAIIGKVGVGKSSFLSSIFGEMEMLTGKMAIRPGISIAFTPQQPWIQNMSIRENILFDRPFDKKFYKQVLEACALEGDLGTFPAGDETEIGEKGANLSGGQKARIGLARAIYERADCFFFDDPLSGVDRKVGQWIFEKVFGPEGMLRGKTRILVTHQINYLQKVDRIFLMGEGGEMAEMGTFGQMMANGGGKFAAFLAECNFIGEDRKKKDSEENAGIEEEFEVEMEGGGGEGEGGLRQLEYEDKFIRLHRESSISSQRVDSFCSFSSFSSRRRQIASSIKSECPPANKNGEEQNMGKLVGKEKMGNGRVKMSIYLDYMRAAGIPLSALFVTLFCLNRGIQMARNYWLSDWANENQQMEGRNGTTGMGPQTSEAIRIAIYGIFGLSEAALFFLSFVVLLLGSLASSRNLHSPMLSRLLHAPMSFFDANPVGRLLNRFGKDLDVLDSVLPTNANYFLNCLTSLLLTLLIICSTCWPFAFFILPLAYFYFYILRLYVPTSRQLKRLESAQRSPIYSHFGESIQGAPSIRAFSKQNEFYAKMSLRVDELIRVKCLANVANRWLAIRLEFLGNFVVLFAAIFGAIFRDWNGAASAGLVGLSVSYALKISEVMSFAVRQISELETNIVSVERMREYAGVEAEGPWEIPENEPPKEWPSAGEIHFVNYSTRYRPGLDLALRGINCLIRPSEKVGIVGRTGAGKSSIAMALFRLIEPCGGGIFIDGVDIGKIGLGTLRAILTIIPQEPILFSGTFRFNLDPLNGYSDSEIWDALANAHLAEFVGKLPNGLEHQIEEGGENISLGQRQLICLARALLRKTQILVLDEATAAVDLQTDALIQSTIRLKFPHSTILTIAHRLETILDYDRVIVLQNGRIREFDPPNELLANPNSLFLSIWKNEKNKINWQ